MTRPAGAPKTRRSATLGLLLALAYLVGTLGGSAHLAEVPHVVCAEHGELEHASQARAPLAHPGSESRPAVQRRDGGEPAPHDACLVVAGLSQGLEREQSPWLRPLGATLVRSAPDPREPCRAFPRHLLAPKHSPPA